MITKKEQLEFCKLILNKYDLGHVIVEEKNKLIEIFKNHPDWEQKRGVGGKYIFINKSDYGHRCFFIKRIDNTITDISFIKAINSKSETDLSKIKKACRSAIVSEIIKFKKENVILGESRCEFSNEILTSENINIDHYDLTFIDMFNLWIKNQDINQLVLFLNKSGDLEQSYYFTDDNIVKTFIEFHNNNCKLRAVTKHINQVVLRKNNKL
jgi:hypothetical protein